MSVKDYIEVYDSLENVDDIEELKASFKHILVACALNDPEVSEDEAMALAEYASVDLGLVEEFTIH